MSQTIKNIAQLKKIGEKQCYYVVDKVAEKVKRNIEEFIKSYYKEYSPKYYERTWRLLNSVVKTQPRKIENGYEVEIYIDTSITYPPDGHWTMEGTMSMANQGMHGRYNGGYPNLWDEAYSDTINSAEIIGQFKNFMGEKGITVTIK